MVIKMKVDNWGKVWFNGEPVPAILWGSASPINGSSEFAKSVKPGLNTIELVVGDGGGLAGFTYLIELAMQADGPLTILPAETANVTYTWAAEEFGSCSVSCGGGIKTRAVSCLGSNGTVDVTGALCDASTMPNAIETCNTNACSVDCVVSPFSDWSSCSATQCGTSGSQARQRVVMVPASGAGAACASPLYETMACSAPACPDADTDGVPDSLDQCAQTPVGETVDAVGCSYTQRVDQYMETSCSQSGSWKNHGAYVSCVAKAVKAGVASGLIMAKDADGIVSKAAQSSVGKK